MITTRLRVMRSQIGYVSSEEGVKATLTGCPPTLEMSASSSDLAGPRASERAEPVTGTWCWEELCERPFLSACQRAAAHRYAFQYSASCVCVHGPAAIA